MDKDSGTAHLLDNEPTIFLGCTGTELMTLAVVGLVSGIILGLILGIFTGIYLFVLVGGLVGLMSFIFKGGKKLGKAKEGFPDGYIGRVIDVWLCRHGLSEKFVVRHGYWRNRR